MVTGKEGSYKQILLSQDPLSAYHTQWETSKGVTVASRKVPAVKANTRHQERMKQNKEHLMTMIKENATQSAVMKRSKQQLHQTQQINNLGQSDALVPYSHPFG